MRAVVTCECCGFRQAVARSIVRPECFFVVCHECEGVLRVDVTAQAIRTAEALASSRHEPRSKATR
jgi:uncharacterized Zn finger protein